MAPKSTFGIFSLYESKNGQTPPFRAEFANPPFPRRGLQTPDKSKPPISVLSMVVLVLVLVLVAAPAALVAVVVVVVVVGG